MKAIETPLKGCVIIEPDVFGDSRGWFYESYSQRKLADLGITDVFVQDNRSYTQLCGTIRGLHCQCAPMAQAKLLTCLRGEITDIAVDIREGSATYLKWTSVKLSADNKRMFYIPEGFLHGFVTLTDHVEVLYKVNHFYSPTHDRSIRYNDEVFGVEWGVDCPVLSDKDKNAPLFADSDVKFVF